MDKRSHRLNTLLHPDKLANLLDYFYYYLIYAEAVAQDVGSMTKKVGH